MDKIIWLLSLHVKDQIVTYVRRVNKIVSVETERSRPFREKIT